MGRMISIPIFAVLYGGVAWFIIWLVWRWTRSKWARWSAVLFFFPVLLVWDIAPGWIYFNHLCRTQSGERISKTVDNVDGIVIEKEGLGCAGACRDALGRWGYKFVEVNVTAPKPDPLNGAAAPGLYRFFLEPSGSPRCELTTQARRQRYIPEYWENRDLPKGYCLAGERIDALSAEHAYYPYELRRNTHPLFYMRRGEEFIRDRSSGEVIARFTIIGFGGGWVASNLGFGREYPYTCPNDGLRERSSFLINVLKPASQNQARD